MDDAIETTGTGLCVWLSCKNQYFDGSVLPPGDKGVQKRDLAIFLWFVREFDAVCFVLR